MCGCKRCLIINASAGRLFSLMLRPIPRSFPGLWQCRLHRRTCFTRRLSGHGLARRGLWRCFRSARQYPTGVEVLRSPEKVAEPNTSLDESPAALHYSILPPTPPFPTCRRRLPSLSFAIGPTGCLRCRGSETQRRDGSMGAERSSARCLAPPWSPAYCRPKNRCD